MRNRTGWRYAAAGLFIACIAAVISYNDGLFVARLAGNHDHQAYLYPFLADGLIIVCLLALTEAARARVPRSKWAQGGIVLGIVLTLAMNVDAGLAHSVLDAVLDGMVPVVFFISVEVVLWHVRRAREDVAGEWPPDAPLGSPATHPGTVPSTSYAAAKAGLAATHAAGNPYSKNKLKAQFRITRAEADELWAPYEDSPADAPEAPNLPAGDSGRGAPLSPRAPAALNGNGPHA